MPEIGLEPKEPSLNAQWRHLRGEFWGLVGLIADVIVDWGTALQNLANRRFWDTISDEETCPTSPVRGNE